MDRIAGGLSATRRSSRNGLRGDQPLNRAQPSNLLEADFWPGINVRIARENEAAGAAEGAWWCDAKRTAGLALLVIGRRIL
jgi:hypothetical protein